MDKKKWKEEKFGRLIEKNELIIEDLPEEKEILLGKKLAHFGYYCEYWKAPNQKSGHLHIKNIGLPEEVDWDIANEYKLKLLEKYLSPELFSLVDITFYKRKEGAEPHRIVTENTEHYKGYGVKTLIQTFGEFKNSNPLDEEILEKVLNVPKDNPLISSNKEIKDWNWLVEQAVEHWNDKKGEKTSRQDKALSLAGYLRKNKGLGLESVKLIITEICSKANDEEISMRLRAVEETFKKNENEIKGISGLDFLKESEQIISLEPYSDSDLENYEPEPVSWLIENQIPKGEIGLLVGKRGVRKTFTALEQALCVASGRSFLGDKVPDRKRVLIIDEENGKNEIAKRTKLLKKGLDLNENLDIHFLSFENLKLNDLTSDKYSVFENYLKELKPDLIIVDCLQRVVSLEVDRDNAGISAFFTGVVRSITKRVGCSWLFIHHMRKGNSQYKPEDQLDEIRGGSELVNYCRYVLMCEEPKKTKAKEDKTYVLFQVLKMSNSLIPAPKVYEFISNDDSIRMEYVGSPDEVLNTEAKIGEAIKNFIIEKEMTGEFRTKDINENAELIGFKRTSLHLGLKWLEEKGEIMKEKRGVWRLSSDEEL